MPVIERQQQRHEDLAAQHHRDPLRRLHETLPHLNAQAFYFSDDAFQHSQLLRCDCIAQNRAPSMLILLARSQSQNQEQTA